MKLYFAYGSNLNVKQMRDRCPKARLVQRCSLPDWRLVFRGVADVIQEEGAQCPGGLWLITPDCERALDAYEGYRASDPEGGMYRKVYLDLSRPIAGQTEIMFYVMNSTGIFPPSAYYLGVIRQGYRDFKLRQKPLNDAVEQSHDDKAPSHIERQRHARKGRPTLAMRPSLKMTTGTAGTGS